MNKSEFITTLSQLKPNYSWSDKDSYIKEKGYNDCKEKILELAASLDEEGLTVEGYKLFRQQTEDLTKVYNELFQVQSMLFEANKQLQPLKNENAEMQKIINELQNQIENLLSLKPTE